MMRQTPLGTTGYWSSHLPYYVLLVLLFFMGVVFGALAVRALDSEQVHELTVFLDQFFSGFETQLATTSGRTLMRDSLNLDLKTLGLIYVLGLTVIGIPVVMAIVFIRGFVIGFTVGFLAYERGVRGVLFALAATFPQNVFVIPAIILAAVTAIMFSILIVRRRRRQWQYSLAQELVGYTAIVTLAVVMVGAGALVKAYVSPILMGLVHRLLF